MTDNDWDQPWVLGKMFTRAQVRCNNLARNEGLLGYEDTAQVYTEIVTELESLGSWVQRQMYEFPPAV